MYVNDSDEPRGTLAYVDNFPAEAAGVRVCMVPPTGTQHE